jgi:sodium transport system permease protein
MARRSPIRLQDVRSIYLVEMRSALREKNIVIYSVLLPLLMYPVMMWLIFSGITFVRGQNESTVSRVVLRDLPPEHAALRERLEKDKKAKVVDSDAPIERLRDDVRSGSVDAVAVFEPATPEAAAAAAPLAAPNFRVSVEYDQSKDRSATAANRVNDAVESYKADWLAREAEARGVSADRLTPYNVSMVDAASRTEAGAFLLKIILPSILILMIALGCFYPAVDTTAGERERSTWETTMTLAASRSSVVMAKYLYVATFGVVAGLLNLTAMMASVGPIFSQIGGKAGGLAFSIPFASLPIIATGAVLQALLIAAGMMILASFARTFKEGQTMVAPFYFVTIMPVMFLQTPDLDFTLALAAIPVVNVAMMFRDAIGGVFQWHLIGVTLAVEVATVLVLLSVARRILEFEDVLMGSFNGSFFKFFKERLLGKRAARGEAK